MKHIERILLQDFYPHCTLQRKVARCRDRGPPEARGAGPLGRRGHAARLFCIVSRGREGGPQKRLGLWQRGFRAKGFGETDSIPQLKSCDEDRKSGSVYFWCCGFCAVLEFEPPQKRSAKTVMYLISESCWIYSNYTVSLDKTPGSPSY